MRVNPNFTPNILTELFLSQNQEQITLQQIASGKLINMPSDNPAGAAALVQNLSEQNQTDQFLQNTSSVEGLLQTADSTLSSVVEALNKAVSLGVQGGTSTVSFEDQQQIAQEVQGIQSQILQLANVSYQGNYVFAGTATTTVPFSANAAAADGVTYNGNNNTNTVEVAEGRSVQTNLPGAQIFQGAGGDVMGSLKQLVTALQSGDLSSIGTATTQLGTALNYVSQQRVFYGNVISQLTSNQSFLQQEQVNLQSQENTLDAVNMAQAATDLSQAQLTQNSTLAALAKIVPVTLLNYLK
ncbi:MAG: flagellar hook-associated protein FlgL [Terriglobales bacterium]